MYLLSVTLTNFKAHRDRNIAFQPGTNAICGENGAGKTSVLEAIAWTLFNYQGSYTKDDLIRNGGGSAQVRVAFVSGRDNRTYEVERCTNRGYTLFDPQLNERLPYTRIRDEVLPWLRQHLGVPPGTDLGQLFANTIGIPQGTFTADFLLSPDKRKPIFDAILKVEEYRAVYQQTNALRRYAEAQVQQLKDQIAQYEERLESWDELQLRSQTLETQIQADQAQLKQLNVEVTNLQQQRQGLMAQAQQLQQLQQQQQQVATQLEGKRQAQGLIEQNLDRAKQAVAICQAQQPAFEGYMAAEKALQTLEEQRLAQQALLKQQQMLQQTFHREQTELTRLQLQLEQQTQLQQELIALEPELAEHARLEAQKTDLLAQQQQLQQVRLQHTALQTQLAGLDNTIQQVTAEIQQLEQLTSTIEQIPQWEQQVQRLQQQLSRIEAAQQFEAELQQLLKSGNQRQAQYTQQVTTALAALDQLKTTVPLMAQAVVGQARDAIATGQTLHQTTLDAIKNILQDLSEQVNQAQLTEHFNQLQKTLKSAYGQKVRWDNLEAQKTQLTQLTQQQQQQQQQLQEITRQLLQLDQLQVQLDQLQQALNGLNDPPGRHRLLQNNLKQLKSVKTHYQQQQKSQAEIQQKIVNLEQQLQTFADLDTALKQQRQLQQNHQVGHRLYLQHQQDAKALPEITAKQQAILAEIETLTQQQQTFLKQFQTLTKSFDPQELEKLELRYSELKTQADQLQGSLPQQRQLHQEIIAQITALKALAEKRDLAQAELKQRDRAKRFINFARKVYKEAGPRITERYVHNISREADRLFRELLNRSNVALEWTRDYEILVQEGAHTRRFINLSGGEQMCAALAVRLALLKILADIDIAFFDEPTTNMDRARRESLAESIARLKSFRQLFVISHDDTFEKVTDNVIMINRE